LHLVTDQKLICGVQEDKKDKEDKKKDKLKEEKKKDKEDKKEKLKEENAIGGSFTPWTCSRYGYTSDVFRYPEGYDRERNVRTINTRIF
jgi:hypothetical protein